MQMAKLTEVKCPHCGNTDLNSIVYLEDVQSQRRLNEIRDGKLIVSGESEEFVEYATNTRLECHADECWEEFPLPKCKLDYE
jgi:hypothetical protein